jgi:hypothetical protein
LQKIKYEYIVVDVLSHLDIENLMTQDIKDMHWPFDQYQKTAASAIPNEKSKFILPWSSKNSKSWGIGFRKKRWVHTDCEYEYIDGYDLLCHKCKIYMPQTLRQ